MCSECSSPSRYDTRADLAEPAWAEPEPAWQRQSQAGARPLWEGTCRCNVQAVVFVFGIITESHHETRLFPKALNLTLGTPKGLCFYNLVLSVRFLQGVREKGAKAQAEGSEDGTDLSTPPPPQMVHAPCFGGLRD